MAKTAVMDDEWTTVIEPQKNYLAVNFWEIWRYKDLIWLFAKRDIQTVYKQTMTMISLKGQQTKED